MNSARVVGRNCDPKERYVLLANADSGYKLARMDVFGYLRRQVAIKVLLCTQLKGMDNR